MLQQLRPFVVAGQQYERIGLVVPQQDVETGPKALDQIGFKQQRLDLGMRRHDLHGMSQADHAQDAGRQTGRVHIALHPVLEIFRLAHIQDLTVGADHAIDAGAVRDGLQRVADRGAPTVERRHAGFGLGRRRVARQIDRGVLRFSGFCHPHPFWLEAVSRQSPQRRPADFGRSGAMAFRIRRLSTETVDNFVINQPSVATPPQDSGFF